MRRSLLIVCLFVLALALTPDRVQGQGWTRGQVVVGGGFVALLTVDYVMTAHLRARGAEESNPILGAHPSPTRLTVYTVGAGVGVLGVATLLPTRWRTRWLIAATALETYAVLHQVTFHLQVPIP